jgi:putative flavoprotein involved in K+ transport
MKNDFLDPHQVSQTWLSQLESALASASADTLAALFNPDCHWRDLLAFDWEIITHSGAAKVSLALANAAALHAEQIWRASRWELMQRRQARKTSLATPKLRRR